MGWFGGLITRQSPERTRHIYDYRVQLDLDENTPSMKLTLEMDRGDPDAVLDSWVLLERSTVEQMDGESRWALVEREGHAAGPL